ncbi:MAG: hypothetical protein OEY87_06460 [Gammaproteobacteria bacterium]|nr:hypothetical protein [Gammaproteobacteria bacterium]MDH5735749.1 hypothetical protein [Gammaproteobacteria bacterium]
MKDITNESLWDMLDARVHELVDNDKRNLFIDAIKGVIESPDEALFWAEILCTDKLTHGDEGRVVVCEAGHDFYQAACEAIDEHGEDYAYFINHISEITGAKNKRLEMPVRIALTGVLHGPDLEKIFYLLGPVQARVRFEQVMDLCHCH